jgi:PIN domain nuclease of toxin-antitoxin system
MSLLLDTHAILWWLAGHELAPEAYERIADSSVLAAVSAASVWEATIKAALGKLEAPESLGQAAVEEGFEPLPITFEHADRVAVLPPHHRDPFDRMLVAQAQVERLTLVTRDPVFDAYDVAVLRC